jgi:hypothetical protein
LGSFSTFHEISKEIYTLWGGLSIVTTEENNWGFIVVSAILHSRPPVNAYLNNSEKINFIWDFADIRSLGREYFLSLEKKKVIQGKGRLSKHISQRNQTISRRRMKKDFFH